MSPPLRPPRDCTFRESDWSVLTRFWFPVAYADEVGADRPLACQLLDERLVVFRSQGGLVAARDLCLHRGAALSLGWVEGGELVCAYHGFRYGGDGRCTRVPAHPGVPIPPKLCLRTFLTAERHGLVWVCLAGDPVHPLPDWPETSQADLRHLRLPPQEWRTSAARQAENFNDVSHLSWVHTGTFGNRERPEVARYEVVETAGGFAFEVDYEFVADRMTGNPNRTSTIRYQYSLHFPFFTRLVVNFRDGKRYLLFDLPSPASARRTRVFFLIAQNYGHDEPAEPILAFQEKVLNEDRPVVESQRPEELPLDLSEEFHIRADRFSTHFRKALLRFGLGGEFTA